MLSLNALPMLLGMVGALLYVALVIAIPVCRFLDWLDTSDPADRPAPRPLPSWLARSIAVVDRALAILSFTPAPKPAERQRELS
ncbi:MAG: hypothetical protein IT306_21020 [Chloroflexi bacterium]|nr:hypothetical protein [Chloroflexota bacterium]